MICTNGTGGVMPEVFRVFHPFDMGDPTLIQIGQPYVLQSMGTGLFCRSVTRSSTRWAAREGAAQAPARCKTRALQDACPARRRP